MTQGGRDRSVNPFPRRPPVSHDSDLPPDLTPIPLMVYGINEPVPGHRWQGLFRATWTGYRRWYLQRDVRTRPALGPAERMLHQHMPELVPTFERMVELAVETGADEVAARMLTLWDPPRFLPGCSQAVITAPEPVLARNYDYSPDLWERVVYSSRFTGRPVIGNNDCLWGLLDGMNGDGLVVSLSFGGRRGSGPGFAVSLVVRYLLEVATTVGQVREILERMPVAMAYNLTVVDSSGEAMTAYVGPRRQPEFSSSPIATNHRGEIPDNEDHARRFASVERRRCLLELLEKQPTADELAAEFLRPPLYSTHFRRAFGTVYTALYRPATGQLELRWPDRLWRRGFDDPDGTFEILLRPS
jgi:predicted choloylglycine hydrolase